MIEFWHGFGNYLRLNHQIHARYKALASNDYNNRKITKLQTTVGQRTSFKKKEASQGYVAASEINQVLESFQFD